MVNLDHWLLESPDLYEKSSIAILEKNIAIFFNVFLSTSSQTQLFFLFYAHFFKGLSYLLIFVFMFVYLFIIGTHGPL